MSGPSKAELSQLRESAERSGGGPWVADPLLVISVLHELEMAQGDVLVKDTDIMDICDQLGCGYDEGEAVRAVEELKAENRALRGAVEAMRAECEELARNAVQSAIPAELYVANKIAGAIGALKDKP